jgi:hypothetical protein
MVVLNCRPRSLSISEPGTKSIEYFFAKRIRNFAEIKRISPPNGSHKTITKKQGVHETNEALLFFRSSVFH